ncbi:MAG: hypothetical protein HC908_15025, partial [Calothrix sp. SM1_7_51]|nr:hypothetical protein [Calothrix sp. SM1_7_51]
MLTEALGIKVTKLNLQSALSQYVQLRCNQQLLPCCLVDWGEAPEVEQFYGRQMQLDTLNQWVRSDRCRLIAIVGMGGIGKTRLATYFAKLIAEQFELVVWRSLRQAPPLIDFLTELMQVMAPDKQLPTRLDAMMLTLIKHLRHHRCLLVLDNIEAVLSSGELVGTYRPGYEDFGWLFQELVQAHHQSTILLTSREIPTEVAIGQGANVPIRLLRLERLSIESGETILRAKGLTFQGEQPQVRQLIERYQGNPLALEIVAYPIRELFDSNIAAFLAQDTLLFKDIRSLLTSQFNRLSSLEVQVMYWLAINREPVTAAQLQTDLLPSIYEVELRDALFSLDRRSLIEKIKPTEGKATTLIRLDDVSYTQQPVVMEYVIQQLIEK